jgi:hypothetical protein
VEPALEVQVPFVNAAVVGGDLDRQFGAAQAATDAARG